MRSLLSCVSLFAACTPPLEQFARRLEARGGTVGLLVVDPDTGERTFEHRANARLLPASTIKLATTRFALQVHGPDYRYATRMEVVGSKEGDTLRASLVIHASGDPSLGSDRFPNDTLDRIADLIAAKEWQGDVIIAGREGEVPYMPGWFSSDSGSQYAAPPTRFVWNENLARVFVARAPRCEPECDRLGWTVTTKPGTDTDCRRLQGQVLCTLAKAGWERVSVDDPALLFRLALEDKLKERAIRWRRAQVPGGEVLSSLTIESPSLRQLAVATNKFSLNLYAERLFALISGVQEAMPGTAVADGSGLSRYDLVTANALVKLLRDGLDTPIAVDWLAGLPISGVDGTLRNRAATGKVFAKTGTLLGQRALAGYALTPAGPRLFAFLLGNYPDDTNRVLDELMLLLTR